MITETTDRQLTQRQEEAREGRRRRPRLGEVLLRRKWINADQLSAALRIRARTGRRLGQVLLEKGWITEQKLVEGLSQQLSVPKVNLGTLDIPARILRNVPKILAEKHCLIPIMLVDDTITVALSDPLDAKAVDAIRYMTGLRVQEVIAAESEIKAAIGRAYASKRARPDHSSDLPPDRSTDHPGDDESAASNEEERLLSSLIGEALSLGASAIHLERRGQDVRVRFRIGGQLWMEPSWNDPLDQRSYAPLKNYLDARAASSGATQTLAYKFRFRLGSFLIGVHQLPILGGEKIVVKARKVLSRALRLDQLGIELSLATQWRRLLGAPQGLLLICGPPESGKTTTLYSALTEFDARTANIFTIEDMVETRLHMVNQLQVDASSGLSAERVLSLLDTADVDVLVIDELSTPPVLDLAVDLANSGMLVIGVVHATGIDEAIARLMRWSSNSADLLRTLRGLLGMKMVRRLCPACRKPLGPVGQQAQEVGPGESAKKDCPKCHNTGYLGQVPLFELVKMKRELRERLLKSDNGRIVLGNADRVASFEEDARSKVERGLTTKEEVKHLI